MFAIKNIIIAINEHRTRAPHLFPPPPLVRDWDATKTITTCTVVMVHHPLSVHLLFICPEFNFDPHSVHTILPPIRTLQEGQYFAHELAKHKVTLQGADQGEGHAEDAEEQIGDGQIEQKNVRNCAHPLVLHQGQDDQRVSDDGQQEDDGV